MKVKLIYDLQKLKNEQEKLFKILDRKEGFSTTDPRFINTDEIRRELKKINELIEEKYKQLSYIMIDEWIEKLL